MPNSPKTAAEIIAAYANSSIMTEYGMSAASGGVDSTAFFRKVVTENQFAYCIFASQAIIDQVATLPPENRHYSMDATFRVVPYGDFNQLLVIHATFIDKVHIIIIIIFIANEINCKYCFFFAFIVIPIHVRTHDS